MTTETEQPWQKLNDPERKRKFAGFMHSRANTAEARLEAGLLVFPDPTEQNLAVIAAQQWHLDPVYIQHRDQLSAKTPANDLPSAEQQARDVYNMASNEKLTPSERLSAHKLFAELRGFIKKPGEGGGGTNIFNDNRRVMVMPAPPVSAEAWEQETVSQQRALVVDANARR